MWFDLIALGILFFFVAMGALRGALASGMSLLTLVGAYLAALTLGFLFAPFCARTLPDLEVLALPLGSSLAFLVALVCLGTISKLLIWLERRQRKNEPRTPLDRSMGGLFGVARGILILFLLGVCGHFVSQGQKAGVVDSLPDLNGSQLSQAAGAVAEQGLLHALEDAGPAATMAAHLAIRPAEAAEDLDRLLELPQVQRLRQDTELWRTLQAGDPTGAMAMVSVQRAVYDDELRQELARRGMISTAAAEDAALFEEDLHDSLVQLSGLMRHARETPEVMELVQNPEVIALVESGDTMALLSNPDLRQAARALLQRMRAEDPGFALDTTDTPREATVAAREEFSFPRLDKLEDDFSFYKYVDEDGVTRFVEDLSFIPKAYRDRAEPMKLSSSEGTRR